MLPGCRSDSPAVGVQTPAVVSLSFPAAISFKKSYQNSRVGHIAQDVELISGAKVRVLGSAANLTFSGEVAGTSAKKALQDLERKLPGVILVQRPNNSYDLWVESEFVRSGPTR